MNLLEHYIKEIISVENITIDKAWAKGIDFVKVKMLVNCYGRIEIKEKLFTVAEWKEVTKVGYYLG